MARTDGVMELKFNKYITSIGSQEYDFLIKGNNSYLNWGDTNGSAGWGIRANAGVMQFKNSGGTWTDFGSGGGSYTFENGLVESSGVVKLGGSLTFGTEINIDGYGLGFKDGTQQIFSIEPGGVRADGVNTVFFYAFDTALSGEQVFIVANNQLFINTPQWVSKPNGSPLVLVDNTTGEVEYSNSATFTVDLIAAQTVDICAPYDMQIDSTNVINGTPTITLDVNGSAYTLSGPILQGDIITVTATVAGVVNLEVLYV